MRGLFGQLKPLQRSLLSGLLGFLFYGAWAYSVNMSHGVMAASKAACVQGSYSFVLTFVMTLLIEYLFRSICGRLNNRVVIIWLTIAITCLLIFSASWWVNVIAQTPEIFETVILGYIIGGVYTVVYVYSLSNSKNSQL
ncbi:MAG: hypothetical protein KTR16_05725 [Acidiferrobacterales bacterium]|nr:hypothetical protein [Acidiferrobacterales bacterium]